MTLSEIWREIYSTANHNLRVGAHYDVTLPAKQMAKLQADILKTITTTGLFLHDEIKQDPEKPYQFTQISSNGFMLTLKEGDEFKIQPHEGTVGTA